MPIRSTILLFAMACGVGAPARAGFQVLSWDLSTALSDDSGDLPIIDSVHITQISNQLGTTSTAQIGTNFASATYDHSWIESLAWGDFNTSFTHQIRTPELTNISTSAIFVQASEPLVITIDGLLNYAHTPGDLCAINYFAAVRNQATMDYAYRYQTLTGELYFGPSSDSISIHGDAVLQPDITYRLSYGLQSDNISDHSNTGTMDASGYVNFSIRPVPEPSGVVLMIPVVMVLSRRARVRSLAC